MSRSGNGRQAEEDEEGEEEAKGDNSNHTKHFMSWHFDGQGCLLN